MLTPKILEEDGPENVIIELTKEVRGGRLGGFRRVTLFYFGCEEWN